VVSEPYSSQRAQCLRLSERIFHSFCSSGDDGCVISVNVMYKGLPMLMFGCYFPYDDRTPSYVNCE